MTTGAGDHLHMQTGAPSPMQFDSQDEAALRAPAIMSSNQILISPTPLNKSSSCGPGSIAIPLARIASGR
jgi:hypothetical protein